jgi:tetratricopeptide (TPR) repeat protein
MDLQNIKIDDITRLFNSYSELLNSQDHSLLTTLSVTRGSLNGKEILGFPFYAVDEDGSVIERFQNPEEWSKVIERLLGYEIISYNSTSDSYSIHPLIKSYYQKRLDENDTLAKAIHFYLFLHYESSYRFFGDQKSLNGLRPLIEAVHHGCKAGLYPEAWHIFIKKINAPVDYILTDKLGSYDTALSIMRDFFPEEDFEKEPYFCSKDEICQILSNVGFCLMSIGHLEEALPILQRGSILDRETRYKIRLSNDYQNISRLLIYLGNLESATISARRGIKAAKRMGTIPKRRTRHLINSMCMLAWTFHLRGFTGASGDLFRKARDLNKDIEGSDIMTKFRGFFYASHLFMNGKLDEARMIAELNLTKSDSSLGHVSRCHRLLGDLDASECKYDSAANHYGEALKIAREISRKEILIEILLSQGRFKLKVLQDPVGANIDLSEALRYATDCGYRLYEVDARYGLALVCLNKGKISASKNQAQYAWQLSQSLGYYWGNVEATKIFSLY